MYFVFQTAVQTFLITFCRNTRTRLIIDNTESWMLYKTSTVKHLYELRVHVFNSRWTGQGL